MTLRLTGNCSRARTHFVVALTFMAAGIACTHAASLPKACDLGDTGSATATDASNVHVASCDEQRLYGLTRKPSGGQGFTPTSYGDGVIAPTPELGNPLNETTAPFELPAGVRVARVRVGMPVMGLPSNQVTDVYLHYSALKKWTATYGNGTTETHVTQLTYPGLTHMEDYPLAVRFDWLDDKNGGHALAMGVPCAKRWCLIGTASSDSLNDPHDPITSGQDPATYPPRTRRVRGWFDRAIGGTGESAYIYPEFGIEKYTEDSLDGAGNARVLAAIVVDGASAEHPVEFFHQREWLVVRTWYSKMKGTNKPKRRFKPEPHPGYLFMPAAARFGKKLYDDPSVTASVLPSVRSLLLVGEGDMWVRCPSGCCNATTDLTP